MLALLLATVRPLGGYMQRVFAGETTPFSLLLLANMMRTNWLMTISLVATYALRLLTDA